MNVLVPLADYRVLRSLVRAAEPPCSMGDLLRGVIRRHIESLEKERPRPQPDRG